MNSYFRSMPGRMLLVATAIFLVGEGLTCLLTPPGGALVARTLSPLLAVVFGVIAVGLGLERHPVPSLLLTVIGPVALWVATMGASLVQELAPAWGHAMISGGVIALVGATLSAMKSPRRHAERVSVHAH